eukprot:TRINITY_DN56833_c0_g1_i1.p1 TRINITY_DN56833_c0_g1~~TRINITY_DN56833_c0_g1_i1.p1  ORF type:complete len:283 (+),score=45.99 TRINITY_DN56833_c0_g1_i1:84-851(+)
MALPLFISDEHGDAPWPCELPADATVADLLATVGHHRGVPAKTLVAEIAGQAVLDPRLPLADAGISSQAVVRVRAADLSLTGVKHWYVSVPEEYKLETLMDLYDTVVTGPSKTCVVFCLSRLKAQWIADKMKEKDFSVVALNQQMPQLVQGVADLGAPMVICTDAVSYGFDWHRASVVVQFDVHSEQFSPNRDDAIPEAQHLRRLGRSALQPAEGTLCMSITFICPEEDLEALSAFEEKYSCEELTMEFMDGFAT